MQSCKLHEFTQCSRRLPTLSFTFPFFTSCLGLDANGKAACRACAREIVCTAPSGGGGGALSVQVGEDRCGFVSTKPSTLGIRRGLNRLVSRSTGLYIESFIDGTATPEHRKRHGLK